jgi:8-oxo-dGTP pyrophosphatase MutT (NUDIX family)
MPDAQTVAALARTILPRTFLDPIDGEARKSLELILQLLDCSPNPFSRHQFTPGHITCSGMVLAPDGVRLLLVHHRRLDRWLPPGGHVESGDHTVAETARREVIEETGAILTPAWEISGADVHGIPAARGEPYHLHHDLVFALQAASDEFRAVAWCTPGEFYRYQIPGSVRRAYQRMLA